MKNKKLMIFLCCCLIHGIFGKPAGLPNSDNICFMNATLQCFYNCSIVTDILLKEEKNKDDFFNAYLDIVHAMYNASLNDANVSYQILKKVGTLGCKRGGMTFGRQQDAGQMLDPVLNVLPSHAQLFQFKTEVGTLCSLKDDASKFDFAENPKLEQGLFITCPINGNSLQALLTEYFAREKLTKENRYRFGLSDQEFVNIYEHLVQQNQWNAREGLSVDEYNKLNISQRKLLYQNSKNHAQDYANASKQAEKDSCERMQEKFNVRIEKKVVKQKGIEIEKEFCVGEDCERVTFMYSFPDYLIIQLVRFQVTAYDENGRPNAWKKNNENITMPFELDMTAYAQDKNEGIYDLIGVIVHSGGMGGGHYWAYIKDQFDLNQPWYTCDDQTISAAMKLSDVRNFIQQGYIFFYVKKSKKEEILEIAKSFQGKKAAPQNFADALASIAKF